MNMKEYEYVVLPEDYEEIMQNLTKAAKICEGPTVISCSCACKQSWNSK